MPKQTIRIPGGPPLLDIASYGRRGPGEQIRISAQDREAIARTVRRVPEVVVKVTGGGSSASRVGQHLKYIGRNGKVEILSDDGQRLADKEAASRLLTDWDLDLDGQRRRAAFANAPARAPARLVYNITLSMPPGTHPQRLLAAAQNFALDEFAHQHRYAMVLHTDEPHPHVHLVVKAMSEQGKRLHVTKATLRQWRAQFARRLREQGIAANATDRAVRGVTTPRKTDGIYRAIARGDSSHLRERALAVAQELRRGVLDVGVHRAKLWASRREVAAGWNAVRTVLEREGDRSLGDQIGSFVEQMPPPETEKEWLARRLSAQVVVPTRTRGDPQLTR